MRYKLVISILLYHTLSPSPSLQYKLEPIPLLYQSYVLYACYKHTIIPQTELASVPPLYTVVAPRPSPSPSAFMLIIIEVSRAYGN